MIALLYMRDLPPEWKARAAEIELLVLVIGAGWLLVKHAVGEFLLRRAIRQARKEEEQFDALWQMRQSDWSRHEDR